MEWLCPIRKGTLKPFLINNVESRSRRCFLAINLIVSEIRNPQATVNAKP